MMGMKGIVGILLIGVGLTMGYFIISGKITGIPQFGLTEKAAPVVSTKTAETVPPVKIPVPPARGGIY
jgi:hypothetical protein